MKEDVYKELKEYFMKDNEVVVNSGKGAQGIKYNKKMFIMFHKGDLLIKLSPDRIQDLIGSGNGQAFDPGTGDERPDLDPSFSKGSMDISL